MKLGIDLSHNNGRVNWDAIKKAGVAFAYIKATEGATFTDPEFKRNRDEAHRVAIEVGFYHFMSVGSQSSDQAGHFLNVVGHVGPGELAPALDVETIKSGPSWLRIGTSTRVEKVRHWYDAVDPVSEGAGQGKCLLYTSPGWFRSVFPNAPFSDHPLWAARYGGKEPDLQGTQWKQWHIWQYTDKGSLPGVGSGNLDLNHMRLP